MTLKRTFVSVIILSAIMLSACVEQENTIELSMEQSHTLKPLGIHEECFEMLKGQAFKYKFAVEQPVLFNIHYHQENDEVIYPIPEQPLAKKSGNFEAQSAQHYCLMWRNNSSDSLTLNYSIN